MIPIRKVALAFVDQFDQLSVEGNFIPNLIWPCRVKGTIQPPRIYCSFWGKSGVFSSASSSGFSKFQMFERPGILAGIILHNLPIAG